MSEATSPSVERCYGLQRVCRVWAVPRSTVYARRKRDAIPIEQRRPRQKPGPVGPCNDDELVGRIRRVIDESPFHGEGYRKVWAKLRNEETRTSKERVRLLMREHGLQAPHRVGNPHGPKAHDRTIIPELPDQMWGTDMTATATLEDGHAGVFVAVDHATAECVGLHAAAPATRFEALEPIRQGVRECFGAFAADVAAGLKLRHDHGSQYMSDDFRNELRFLGIESSPSFVREPEGNGCAERFIRTLKENLLWVRSFRTIEELRQALIEFKDRYNRGWIIQRHGYRTPSQARHQMLSLNQQAA